MREKTEFPNDTTTNEWLDSQKASTRTTYAISWNHFLTFVKMTGGEILADHMKDTEYQWEKKVISCKQWAIEKGFSENSARTITTAARSFFTYHRKPLQFRKQESRRIDEARTEKEDYRFNLQDLKKLFDVADLPERYVVTAGKSFGLRAGDFIRLTRGQIEPYIEREIPISLGQLNTQKESVKAYPFIDSDAQPVIKLILEKMTREGKTQPSDRLCAYANKIRLSRVLKRLAKKAGLVTGDKVVRFHCLRKFLSDHLSSHMSESKWKQIVGKTISEGAYISADSLREDYARAMAETCFNQGLDDRARAAAKAEFEKTFTPEQQDFIKRHGTMRFSKIKKEQEPKTECTDGEHCQKVVNETELPDMLSQGWHASIVLPSGKIVIER